MNPAYQPLAKKRWPRWARILVWTMGILFAVGAVATLVLFIGVRNYAASQGPGGGDKTQAQARLKSIEILLWTRKKLLGSYPTEKEGLEKIIKKPTNDEEAEKAAERLKDPWHRKFQYRIPGIHHPESYDLFSLGPDGIEGTEDDITNW